MKSIAPSRRRFLKGATALALAASAILRPTEAQILQFSGATLSPTFFTNFPTAENPISIGGKIITSTSPGVSWTALFGPISPVRVVSPGLAESVDYANPSALDALAVLTGTWSPNQSASVTVGSLAATPKGPGMEFEIHLRVDPTTGTGYEITWGYSRPYLLITAWTVGSFSQLYLADPTAHTVVPGDVLSASIVGNVITMYTNGAQVAQITDNTFATGNPGFGFNVGGTDEYGAANFSATGL